MPGNLPLTPGARAEAVNLTTTFDNNLKGIASAIADDAGADQVIVPHVKDAYLVLRRCGLEQPPGKWYKRSDVKVAAGWGMAGLSPSVGGFAYSIIAANPVGSNGPATSHPVCFWLFVVFVPVVTALAGMGFALTGMARIHR